MREVELRFAVVMPDDADPTGLLAHLRGREFPGLPGSWVVRTSLAHSPAAPATPTVEDPLHDQLTANAKVDDRHADDTEDGEPEDPDPTDQDPTDQDPGDRDRGD